MIRLVNIVFLIVWINIITFAVYNNTELLDQYLSNTYFQDILNFFPLTTNGLNIAMFVFVAILLSINYSLIKRFSPRYRVFVANKTLKRMRSLNLQPMETIAYLRKIDPFVFEEMLLSVFKEIGYKIKRNKKYTGDGGTDGQVWINKKHHHIQAKRYASYINKQHMIEFIQLNKERKTKGLFIHTGKTGKETKLLAKNNDIEIISGERLYNFIIKKEYKKK
jgi:restriction system protein